MHWPRTQDKGSFTPPGHAGWGSIVATCPDSIFDWKRAGATPVGSVKMPNQPLFGISVTSLIRFAPRFQDCRRRREAT